MERGRSPFIATLTLTPLCRYTWLVYKHSSKQISWFCFGKMVNGRERLVSLLGDLTAVYYENYAGYVAQMGLSFALASVALEVVLPFSTVLDTELTMCRFP